MPVQDVHPDIAAARAQLVARHGGAIRAGGRGAARRTRRRGHHSGKRLQAQLHRLGAADVPFVEEVNMFRDDGFVLHFVAPRVQASARANAHVVVGRGECKRLQDLLPGIENQLWPESIAARSGLRAARRSCGGLGHMQAALSSVCCASRMSLQRSPSIQWLRCSRARESMMEKKMDFSLGMLDMLSEAIGMNKFLADLRRSEIQMKRQIALTYSSKAAVATADGMDVAMHAQRLAELRKQEAEVQLKAALEAAAEWKAEAPMCPSAHMLELRHHSNHDYRCAGCKKRVCSGETVMVCQLCRWGLCGDCCPRRSRSQATSITISGYRYRVIRDGLQVDGVPTANPTDQWLPMPAGYELAPDTADVRNNVVAAHTWSTHIVVLGSLKGYCCKGFRTAGEEFKSRDEQKAKVRIKNGVSEYRTPWEKYQVLIRQKVSEFKLAEPHYGWVESFRLRLAKLEQAIPKAKIAKVDIAAADASFAELTMVEPRLMLARALTATNAAAVRSHSGSKLGLGDKVQVTTGPLIGRNGKIASCSMAGAFVVEFAEGFVSDLLLPDQICRRYDFQLEALRKAVDAAEAVGIDVSTERARLAELLQVERAGLLKSALLAVKAASIRADGRREIRAAHPAATSIIHGAYAYRTMVDGVEVDGTPFRNQTDQWFPLPPGYEVAPDTADVRSSVVAPHTWSTQIVVLGSLKGYCSRGHTRTPGAEWRGQRGTLSGAMAEVRNNNGISEYRTPWTQFQVLIRRRVVDFELAELDWAIQGAKQVGLDTATEEEELKKYRIEEMNVHISMLVAISNAAMEKATEVDYKLEDVSDAIAEAKVLGIDTSAIEKRLGELRCEEKGAAVRVALAAVEAGKTDTQRPTSGDVVMAGGRRGVIVVDDQGSLPFVVQYEDDGETSDWLCEKGVEKVDDVDSKLEKVSEAIQTAKNSGYDTAAAEIRLAELRHACKLLDEANTIIDLEVALDSAIASKLHTLQLALGARRKLGDMLLNQIQGASDAKTLQSACIIADKPNVAKYIEDSPKAAEFKRELSVARSRLHEFAEEDKRRQERQEHGVPEPDMPEEFRCPISAERMVDPVTAADGFSYERSNIERWLRESEKSPKTNGILPHKSLVPNTALRIIIRDWPTKEHKHLMSTMRAVQVQAQRKQSTSPALACLEGLFQDLAKALTDCKQRCVCARIFSFGYKEKPMSSQQRSLEQADECIAEVTGQLKKLGLAEYAPAMIEDGYDDWEQIMGMTPTALDDLCASYQMKKGHTVRLKTHARNAQLVAKQQAVSVGTYVEDAEERFARMDANANGSISKDEFLAWMAGKAEELFDRMDANKDSRISKDEHLAYLASGGKISIGC
mmetsp:Transcript_126551/g.252963  ORF Transcript_126551/g.252963 Transcript_126551/m.252963 type:complete len:1348 (-) Transcript_126551:167-4210(-)